MSTGDYMRYLRAVKGGPTPFDIEHATGVAASTYRQIEQLYRSIGTEEELAKLADYFDVPVEELNQRQQWSRKALSAALVEAEEEDRSIRLELRSGAAFSGRVIWSDLGSVLLEMEDGREIVFQRHMVDRWELL